MEAPELRDDAEGVDFETCELCGSDIPDHDLDNAFEVIIDASVEHIIHLLRCHRCRVRTFVVEQLGDA